jgi:hypothetical protein
MAPMETFTHPLTIGGETRNIEFFLLHADRAWSLEPVGAFQKRGGKIWAHTVALWLQNGEWQVDRHVTILNRNNYRLIGWADKLVIRNPSHHNSAHELRS